ncbi:MAG: radical SAM protein, partial [Treponema sp.]|nr:radical SAM protein [Treponema sp.]
MKKPVCLVQPPFAQLNSPYPGIYYLRSFLERRGFSVITRDHSIALFERIFCREGLRRIFEDAEKAPGLRGGPGSDRKLRPVIEGFLSEKELWLSSIDRLVNFLRGRDHEWGHLLCLANGVVPGGPRFDACLASLGGFDSGAQISPDSAQLLAGKLLADLSGFITAALDPGFSLIRYIPSSAESPGAGFRNFSAVRAGLDGYVMDSFYRPFLEEEWKTLSDEGMSGAAGPPPLLGLSIPFPGCLTGALACAASAKKFFGAAVTTAAGGGYVNTELRFAGDERVFDYFDYLSFDRGYGSLAAILEAAVPAAGGARQAEVRQAEAPLYKTIYRRRDGGLIRGSGIAAPAEECGAPLQTPLQNPGGEERYAQTDDEAVKSVFPDYSGVDFSRYLCPLDDLNP